MKNKPLIVKKSVKHTFTPEETKQLNVDFRQSYANLKAVEADADSVKSQLKAKITEAESRMETLNATLQAGFEMRDKECVVIFRTADKKKDFYLPDSILEDGHPTASATPVITEAMTPQDFEQDLFQAEAAFESKAELILWQAGNDLGRLIIGSLQGKWFTALRGNVGAQKIEERLDGEQSATKKRFEAVQRAAKRAGEWLAATLGKEASKGFTEPIAKVVEGEREKAE